MIIEKTQEQIQKDREVQNVRKSSRKDPDFLKFLKVNEDEGLMFTLENEEELFSVVQTEIQTYIIRSVFFKDQEIYCGTSEMMYLVVNSMDRSGYKVVDYRYQ